MTISFDFRCLTISKSCPTRLFKYSLCLMYSYKERKVDVFVWLDLLFDYTFSEAWKNKHEDELTSLYMFCSLTLSSGFIHADTFSTVRRQTSLLSPSVTILHNNTNITPALHLIHHLLTWSFAVFSVSIKHNNNLSVRTWATHLHWCWRLACRALCLC